MRSNFEMTQEQLDQLMGRCKATPVIQVGGVDLGRSAQENANDAWESLGKTMGFKPMTVQPNGRGQRFFSAEPVE